MKISIAYICLKVSENGSMHCIIILLNIFVQICSEKCNIKKKKQGVGGAFWRGALNGETRAHACIQGGSNFLTRCEEVSKKVASFRFVVSSCF